MVEPVEKVKVLAILYKQQITEILLLPLYPWIDAHEESKSQQSLIRHPHTHNNSINCITTRNRLD